MSNEITRVHAVTVQNDTTQDDAPVKFETVVGQDGANLANDRDLSFNELVTVVRQGRMTELDDRNLMRLFRYAERGFNEAVARTGDIAAGEAAAMANAMMVVKTEIARRQTKGMSVESVKTPRVFTTKQPAWTKEGKTTTVKINGQQVSKDAGVVERERRAARIEKEEAKAAKAAGQKPVSKKDKEIAALKAQLEALQAEKEQEAARAAKLQAEKDREASKAAKLQSALKAELLSEGCDEDEAEHLIYQEVEVIA